MEKTTKTKNKNKVIVDPHILSMISKVPWGLASYDEMFQVLQDQ